MTDTTLSPGGQVGALLREWRRRRRRSQFDLALDAGVSARHLSFVETGRAKPSPRMVLPAGRGARCPAARAQPAPARRRVRAGLPGARARRPDLRPIRDAVQLVLLDRLGRQHALTGDPALRTLHAELAAYPAPAGPAPAGSDVVVPLRLRTDGGELRFLSTVTTFGTPADITVEELSIEAFLPADAATAEVLRRLAPPLPPRS